ncbi:MAG TPA: ATP-binding protein [Patescibacteria group bacterium]|nr:ATP-binding protein [Patescibacteria group bacterium]
MKVRFRTNLALLSVSAAMALASAFIVSFGGTKLFRGDLLPNYPLLPAYVLALGVTGVFLILSKGKALPPFVDHKVVGYLALAPLAVTVAVAGFFRVGPALAFFLLAMPCAAYAIRAVEPAPEEATHDLNDFFGAGILLLFGILGYLLPIAHPFIHPVLALAVALAVAPAAAYVCWRDASGRRAAIARAAVGAILIALGALASVSVHPIYAVLYLPTGLFLVLRPFLGAVRMGGPAEAGLTEENVVVASFEKMAEMTAWSVYIFTLIHAYFNPPGLAGALFALFVAAFAVFSFEYEMVSSTRATYGFIQKKSIANAILLGVISHLTGGIQSPYIWFFILILTSGAFVPNPRMILRRLYVILFYYLLEILYSLRIGALNESLLVDHLMVQVFVIGLAGVYAYRLALRRRQIDADLMAKNDRLEKALENERIAKELLEKQADQIAREKKQNESLLASLADAVIGFDAGGLITSLNPAAEALLGLTLREAHGKRLRDILRITKEDDPGFRLGNYMDSGLKGNAIPLPENVYVETEGGRRIYLTGVVLPILDESRRVTGIVVTMSDVTYTREVDQMKTGFLSVAAHQLRTPLSTIRWYLELLNDPTEGKLKKNQKMFAENAYLSLRKMVGLVNRLLAVTRLESGRVPFKPEPTDLKAMTVEILDSLKPKLSERRLEIRTDLPDMPAVPLDPSLAREVFTNLIENAIRYTPDGGTIVVETRDEKDHLAWSVKDDGIGIPKAQQQKIFEKFFRASNAVEHSSEGSGLGLYLAKFIVEIWGGTIGFASEEGKGTTFHVTIPKAGMKPKGGQVSLNA